MARAVAVTAVLLAALALIQPVGASDPWTKLHRSLHIPRIASGSPCTVTRSHQISPDFAPGQGPGPVYPVSGSNGRVEFIYPVQPTQVWYPSAWGGQKVLWVGSPSYTGPVLIRGRQLDGPHTLRFGGAHNPSGELRLTRGGASSFGWNGREWPSYTRLRAAGCYAWQVDGTSFTTVIMFKAIIVR